MKSNESPRFQHLLVGLRHVAEDMRDLKDDDGVRAAAVVAKVDQDVLQHATPYQQLFALRELRGRMVTWSPRSYFVRYHLTQHARRVAEQLGKTVPPMPHDKIAEMGERASMQQAIAGGQPGQHDWRADPPVPPKLRIRGDVGTLTQLGGKVPLKVGIASAQGVRSAMEDVHLAETQGDLALVGVFDGHGGQDVAKGLARELLTSLQAFVTAGAQPHEMRRGLKDLFATKVGSPADARTLDALLERQGHRGGSTALVAVLDADRFYIANIGDSRAVLVDGAGNAKRMSVDQWPAGMEYERIRNNHGRIVGGRLDHVLAMGRAVGDWSVNGLTRRPQITAGHVDDGQCLIMACDGFWDVINDEAGARMAHEMFAAGMPADQVAENLTRAASALGTTDNVTVAVLQLRGDRSAEAIAAK